MPGLAPVTVEGYVDYRLIGGFPENLHISGESTDDFLKFVAKDLRTIATRRSGLALLQEIGAARTKRILIVDPRWDSSIYLRTAETRPLEGQLDLALLHAGKCMPRPGGRGLQKVEKSEMYSRTVGAPVAECGDAWSVSAMVRYSPFDWPQKDFTSDEVLFHERVHAVHYLRGTVKSGVHACSFLCGIRTQGFPMLGWYPMNDIEQQETIRRENLYRADSGKPPVSVDRH